MTVTAVGDNFVFDRAVIPALSTANLGYTFTAPLATGDYTGEIHLTQTAPYSSSETINVTAHVTTDIIVGNGTSNGYLPTYIYYGYGYSQTIYYPSELNWPSGYRIEKLYYYYNGVETAEVTKDWVIYMGHTTQNTFGTVSSWIPLSQLTQVYAGENIPQLFAGGYWMEFTLNTPFIYNGTSNLVIGVDENCTGYDGSGAYFYSTPCSTNRSILYYADDTNPDPAAPPDANMQPLFVPNTKFYMAPVPVNPIMTLTPTFKNWGSVIINGYYTQTFTIQNTGGNTLIISNISSPAAPFNLSNVPDPLPSLAAGQSATFDVVYHPTAVGTHHSEVNITDNRGRTLTPINLDGICYDPTIILPYDQTFTAAGWPNGWTHTLSGWTTDLWTIDATNQAGGTANEMVCHYATSSGGYQETRAITPPINTTGMSTLLLQFKHYYSDYSSGAYLRVQTSSNGTTWHDAWSYTSGSGSITATTNNVTINTDLGGTTYICWYVYGDTWQINNWNVDDVHIEQMLSDTLPPVITFVPWINSVNNIDGPVFSANVADDTTWNSGIQEALLNYNINSTGWNSVPMLPTGVGTQYQATLPPQAWGTQISYYYSAIDNSAAHNAAQTATHGFTVDSPTWYQYDDGTLTTNLGLSTAGYIFQVGNTFFNDSPNGILQLNSVTGGLSNGGDATLHVYDDNWNDLITPFSHTFAAGVLETVPLVAPLQITAPYFMAAWEGIAAPNYFPLDQDSNMFTGVGYILYTPDAGANWYGGYLEDIGWAGSWLLRANVQVGAIANLLPPTDVSIFQVGTDVEISWTDPNLPVASSFYLYGANDPYAFWPDDWFYVDGPLAGPTILFTPTDPFAFYMVTASNDAPIIRNHQAVRAQRAPKFNLTNGRMLDRKSSPIKSNNKK